MLNDEGGFHDQGTGVIWGIFTVMLGLDDFFLGKSCYNFFGTIKQT
jgi:hypothetical protein